MLPTFSNSFDPPFIEQDEFPDHDPASVLDDAREPGPDDTQDFLPDKPETD